MRIPGNAAVRRIRPKSYPLVTACTKDAVGLELRHLWVCSQVVDALLLCALCAPPLYRWVGWGVDVTEVSIRVSGGATVGCVGELVVSADVLRRAFGGVLLAAEEHL